MSKDLLLLVAVAGGAYYYYTYMMKQEQQAPSPVPLTAAEIPEYNERVRAENMLVEAERLHKLQGRVDARAAEIARMKAERAAREADREPAIIRARAEADAWAVAHPLNLRMELFGGTSRVDTSMYSVL